MWTVSRAPGKGSVVKNDITRQNKGMKEIWTAPDTTVDFRQPGGGGACGQGKGTRGGTDRLATGECLAHAQRPTRPCVRSCMAQ